MSQGSQTNEGKLSFVSQLNLANLNKKQIASSKVSNSFKEGKNDPSSLQSILMVKNDKVHIDD